MYCIFGYSDDNWLLAPSLSALQDMLNTCEEYAAIHNLKFSTDENPEKCKTKLMAFLKKSRELPRLKLCGTDIPWVNKVKHLGNTITNTVDGCQKDMMIKTAILHNDNFPQNFNMPIGVLYYCYNRFQHEILFIGFLSSLSENFNNVLWK